MFFFPFRDVGARGRGGGLVGCVQGQVLGAHASCLPRFILLVSFSNTSLVILILDVVYDCHLRSLLRSWMVYWWFLCELWVFVGVGVALSRLWGWGTCGVGVALSRLWGWGACGLCPGSRAWRAGTSPSKVFPAGKLQWHFTCGFNFRHSLWLPLLQPWKGY